MNMQDYDRLVALLERCRGREHLVTCSWKKFIGEWRARLKRGNPKYELNVAALKMMLSLERKLEEFERSPEKYCPEWRLGTTIDQATLWSVVEERWSEISRFGRKHRRALNRSRHRVKAGYAIESRDEQLLRGALEALGRGPENVA